MLMPPMPANPVVIPNYAPAPAKPLRLHRMPLVWVAVIVPAGFLLWMFLTPSL